MVSGSGSVCFLGLKGSALAFLAKEDMCLERHVLSCVFLIRHVFSRVFYLDVSLDVFFG